MGPNLGGSHVPLDLARGEIPWTVLAPHLVSLDLGAVLRDGFNYSSPAGLDQLRDVFVDRFATCARHRDDVLVTGGALGALDLAFRALRRDRPRARLVVMEPTYREALGIARAVGLPIVGWRELGGSLCSDDVVYLVPSYNNPDGRSLSIADRESVVAAVVGAGAALVEDAAYELLAVPIARSAPGLCAAVTAQDQSAWALRLMSFSKSVCPGARVCVVEGSATAMAGVRSLKLDFGTAPVACALVTELVREPGTLEAHVAAIVDRLDRGRDAARQAFEFWGRPPAVGGAGYFLWLSTSEVSGDRVAGRAAMAGVKVSDGGPFFVDGRSTHVRLSVGWESPERVHEACLLLEGAVALVHTPEENR